MLIAFWGPVDGQVHTTSNMVAIATTIALDHHTRILMTHTHVERSNLEQAFTRLRQSSRGTTAAIGMDAIERLVQCGKLTPEGVRDNAESILKDRLDLISGSTNEDTHLFRQVLPHIFEAYKRFYELLFIDVSSGTRNELSSLVMEHADLIVVNLNQNKFVLDALFAKEEWPSLLNDKRVVFCLGAYERHSKMTVDRIAKQYGIPKNRIGFVPYNVRYMDAHNDQDVIDYLIKARSAKKRFLEFNEDVYFTQSVRSMGNNILDALDLHFMMGDEDHG